MTWQSHTADTWQYAVVCCAFWIRNGTKLPGRCNTAIRRLTSVIRSCISEVLHENSNRKPISHHFKLEKIIMSYVNPKPRPSFPKPNYRTAKLLYTGVRKRLYLFQKFCCLVGAILKILCPWERRVFQSKLRVSSSNQCNLHHSPHTGHLGK